MGLSNVPDGGVLTPIILPYSHSILTDLNYKFVFPIERSSVLCTQQMAIWFHVLKTGLVEV